MNNETTGAAERVAAALDWLKQYEREDRLTASQEFPLLASDLRALLVENARLKATAQPEVLEILKQITYIGPAEPARLATKAMVIMAEHLGRSVEAQPATEIVLDEREAFEAWAKRHGWTDEQIASRLNDKYTMVQLVCAWDGWQARASLPVVAVQEGKEQ